MAEQIESQEEYDWARHTDLPVGEILRRTRCHYNFSMPQVAAALHIRAEQLTAIEEGAIEKLPGRVYAIGFVRSYSEFLGLDGDKMVHLFKVQMRGGGNTPELSFPVPASESKAPSKEIIAGCIAALAVIIIGAYILVPSSDPVPVLEDPQQVTLMSDDALQDNAVFGPLQDIEPAAGPAKAPIQNIKENKLIITASDNAWVEIRDADGKALISRILKPGESYIVPDRQGLVMDTGNVGVLAFELNGESMPSMGAAGDVKRNIDLDDFLAPPQSFVQPASAETQILTQE